MVVASNNRLELKARNSFNPIGTTTTNRIF